MVCPYSCGGTRQNVSSSVLLLLLIPSVSCSPYLGSGSRKVLLGSFRKFQIDDMLMLMAVATDTALLIGLNILSTKKSNLIDPNDPPILTPEDIEERVFGSKLVLVVGAYCSLPCPIH